MRHYRHIMALIAASIFVFSTLAAGEKTSEQDNPAKAATAEKKIEWLSYDEGLARAKAEGKHVFVDFTTSWCGWCKKMEKETFSRPDVIDLVNNNFIPVRVDGDSNNELNIEGFQITEKKLSRSEFGVRGYPTFWFLKSDGSKLGNITGYKDAGFMMKALVYVKDYEYDTTRTNTPDTQENP